jgi:hypothetical protein
MYSYAIYKTQTDTQIYNGRQEVVPTDQCFTTMENVMECVNSIKQNNVKGYDRIPQGIIKDRCSSLVYPHYILINKIYNQREIPEQWRVNKIIPNHKTVINPQLKTAP